ncbi:MAG: hypothetical protein IPH16_10735 [Haliscomenobacter sp.]|nr:hypothetical protein [Haliscomenobacter sp.]
MTQAGAGLQNGGSWANALSGTQLQYAINLAANCGAQVWVAKGTYYPTADESGNPPPSDPPTKPFSMKSEVGIYGGFAGNEAATYDLSLRDFVTNETILSGDIDGTPDVVTGSGSTLSITGNSGNAYHVIYNNNNGLTTSAVLDGFTISGGNANAGSGAPHTQGGGIYNNNSSPTISQCTFSNNVALSAGGGLFTTPATTNLTMSNCFFKLNMAMQGGGIYNQSLLVLNNSQITNNKATSNGGGIYNSLGTSLSMTGCQVTGNDAGLNFGGGIYSTRPLTLSSCQINNNSSGNAGGILMANRPLIMTNCEVKNNTTVYQGSGINLQDVPSATLTNCEISGNVSQNSQGGIANYSAFFSTALLTLINCTVANNTSVGGYRAIWTGISSSGQSATTILKNTIVANNPGGNFLQGDDPAMPTLFGTVQSQGNNLDSDGSSGFTNGVNGDLVNVNPLFVSATDVHLQPCSPAINVGNNDANATTTDLDGNTRKFGVIDMGAYEYQGDPMVITLSAPSVTQPSCATPTGTIVVNATSSGTLEYSVDNGMNWQASATFIGLAPGNYNIKVRLVSTLACEFAYASNPVMLNSAFSATTTDTWTGCVSTDWATPGNWQDGSVPTVADDAVIPNTTNKPTIFGGTAAVAKTIEVQSGTTLTITTTASLTVNGSKSVPSGGSTAFLNDGTVQNNGQLTLGNISSIGGEGLYNRGTFNNNTGGHIKIDRSTFRAILNREATFNNSGLITIGASVSVGERGLNNFGSTAAFNNNAGEIKIDNTTGVGLNNEGGSTFTNAAKITIGATASIGREGLFNTGTFNNNMGGDIKIDRTNDALFNQNTFSNSGLITIGASASVGSVGIINFTNTAIFNNNTGGEIKIDRSTNHALYNGDAATFNNASLITIGAMAGVNENGLTNQAMFNNNTGGEIKIDNVTARGLWNLGGTFTNAAKITIGATASIGNSGIENNAVFNNNAGGDISIKQTAVDGVQNDVNSTFNNNACAILTIFDNLNNSSTFTNSGLFTVNTTQTHTNSALTNNGIIAYPQGNPIPNVTNNEIIIAPTTANDCGPVSPAFGLGSPVDFTILGIFTDEAATTSAGTYVQATNTFTPVPVLAVGAYTLYVKIEDGNGGCTRVIPWMLTVEDNVEPLFDCTTLTDITANNDAGQCYATVSVTAPQASDNCSGTVTATGVRDDNAALTAVYPVGTTTITWTFTDAAGKEKNAPRKWW